MTTPLPRNSEGEIETSAEFGECWFAQIEYNTHADGSEVFGFEEDPPRTLHGPFDSPQEAADWLNAYPDDTDVHDMTVQVMNRVRPGPAVFTFWEYGVERSLPSVNGGEPYIEWGGSVGMSHNYPYTEESVHGLAGGNRVFRRAVTTTPSQYGEPELFPRKDKD